MNWLALMMGLSCKLLAVDERSLARAARLEERRLTICEGRGCVKYIEALTDIHDRMDARRTAWVAKECGGPEGDS